MIDGSSATLWASSAAVVLSSLVSNSTSLTPQSGCRLWNWSTASLAPLSALTPSGPYLPLSVPMNASCLSHAPPAAVSSSFASGADRPAYTQTATPTSRTSTSPAATRPPISGPLPEPDGEPGGPTGGGPVGGGPCGGPPYVGGALCGSGSYG